MFLPGSTSSLHGFDHAMRASLAQSLEHIHSVGARQIGCDDLNPAVALAEIRAHRVKPGIFGRYFDLGFAVQARRYAEAGTLLREIVDLASEQPGLTIVPLTEQALGADKPRYARLVDLDSRSPSVLEAPDPDRWAGFEDEVRAALDLIERADAALAGELRALVIQVVGAVRSSGGEGVGGASSLMLWGAVFLYVLRNRTRLDLVEGLVHEGAHKLLFGLSLDEPLVENPVEERFDSPLRKDPRPMDGVFHATFVCARIHYAFQRLRDDPAADFSPAELRIIDQRMSDQRTRFSGGLETVRQFGRMTATGERILAATADYMRSAA